MTPAQTMRAHAHHRGDTAGILATQGIVLTPAVGALLMSASTVIVAINAHILRLPHPGEHRMTEREPA